jgi:HK97 family phage major capsid protein
MMTAQKLADLQKEGLHHTTEAKKIAESQGDNDPHGWSEDTLAKYNEHMTKAKEKLEEIKVAKSDLEILSAAKDLAFEIGEPAADDVNAQGNHPERKAIASLGAMITKSAEFKALMAPFDHSGEISIPKGTKIHSAPIPVKSLITGASSTSGGAFVVTDRTDIVEMLGRKELKLRDLVSVRRTGSDLVEYVRQTSHTNAAAVVAEATSNLPPTAPEAAGPLVPVAGAGVKPEGSWAFEIVQTAVKTIAEMAAITKRALADVAQLEGLINDELEADVKDAEETQILVGDGSGENFTGILNTSGIQTQAWTTDFFTTTRKAITKARFVGRVNPTAWVMNPVDAEAVDLMKDNENRYYYGGPQALGQRTLWGKPIVEVEDQPVGRGLLGDFSKAVIWDREQTTVTMTDSHEDWFKRNLIAVLAEERLAFGVTRPTAFVDVDLTA